MRLTKPDDIKQMRLFSEEWIALWVIGHEFEEMYPEVKYKVTFERNPLCD